MSKPNVEIIYLAEGFSHSWYDYEKRVFVYKVYNLNLGVHRQLAFELNIKAMERFNPSIAIIDASKAIGHHQPADMEWMIDIAFPTYRKMGVNTVIYIQPQNIIAGLGGKTWMDIGKKFGINFIEKNSLEEAYSHLHLIKI